MAWAPVRSVSDLVLANRIAGSLVVVQALLLLAACRIRVVVVLGRVVVAMGLAQGVGWDTVVERLPELQ